MVLSFTGELASIREDIDDQECTVVTACWASPADSCNALQNCDCYNTQADCNDNKGTVCELQTNTYYRFCNTNDDNDWEWCEDESKQKQFEWPSIFRTLCHSIPGKRDTCCKQSCVYLQAKAPPKH